MAGWWEVEGVRVFISEVCHGIVSFRFNSLLRLYTVSRITTTLRDGPNNSTSCLTLSL